MSKRFPRARWVLPTVIDPPERLCFQVEVPNERFHIAAFRGALLILASALSWQNDPDHKAKDVAKVWDEIYQKVRTCDVIDTNTGILLEDLMSQQIRISPDDPCIIQMWCVDNWQDWYDPRSCITGLSSQSAPQGELETDECRTFFVALRGNEQYLLPVPVSEGYTIQISNAVGGWWDGNVLHAWNCPSGLTYALGACLSAGATDAGSPIPALSIGRLITQIDGVYYDAFNQTITVPAGVSLTDVFFQMNDDNLADNQGSISFEVRVCEAAVVTWEHDIDFSSVTGGFAQINYPSGYNITQYVPAVGWRSNCGPIDGGAGRYDLVAVYREFSPAIHLQEFSMLFDDTVVNNPSSDHTQVIVYQGATPTTIIDVVPSTGDDQTLSWTGDISGITKIEIRPIFGSAWTDSICHDTQNVLLKTAHFAGIEQGF